MLVVTVVPRAILIFFPLLLVAKKCAGNEVGWLLLFHLTRDFPSIFHTILHPFVICCQVYSCEHFQPAFTCSKLTIETVKQGSKLTFVLSDHRRGIYDIHFSFSLLSRSFCLVFFLFLHSSYLYDVVAHQMFFSAVIVPRVLRIWEGFIYPQGFLILSSLILFIVIAPDLRGYFLPSDVFYLALCQVLVRNIEDSVQSEGNCWITLRQKRCYNYPRQFIQLIDKGHCNTLQTRQWLRKYKTQTRSLNWQRNILTSLFLKIHIERKNKQAFF